MRRHLRYKVRTVIIIKLLNIILTRKEQSHTSKHKARFDKTPTVLALQLPILQQIILLP